MAAYWQIVFKDLTCCRTLCPQWFRLISSWVACKQDALSRKRIYFSFQYFHGNCWLDWSYLEGNASCRAGRNLWMLQQPKRMCFLNVCWLVDWYHVQATPLPNWPRTSMDVHNGEKIWKKFSRVKQPSSADLHVYPVEISTLMRPLIHQHGTSAFHLVNCR